MKAVGQIVCAAVLLAVSGLRGETYTITDKAQAIPALTGTDTLVVRLATVDASSIFRLEGERPDWAGVLDIQQGIVVVTNASALGTSVIYNTNETFAARSTYNARLEFLGEVTAANTIHIGSETPLDYTSRIVSRGKTVLTGPMYFVKGNVRTHDGGTLTLAGDLTCSTGSGYSEGSSFVLYDHEAPAAVRITVTGRFTNLDTLYVHGKNTGAKIMTAGQKIAYPIATHGGQIVCGVDDVFEPCNIIGRNMANAAGSYLDLNGTSQTFKNNNQQTNDSGLRIRNSNEDAHGVFTVTQTTDNRASNLTAVGPLDFVKKGARLLVLTNDFHIAGTLDVAEGTLKLTGPQPYVADEVIVRSGATLDLGGRTYACGKLTLAGGTVRNGWLQGATNSLASGCVSATLAGGVTEKTGTDTVTLSGGVTSGRATLTNGLVCCYHFDSEETLFEDAGPYGYTLANCWTNMTYEIAPSLGPVTFDADNGRYGSGSASFPQHVFLSYPGGYPEKAPHGRAPFTLAFWYRVHETISPKNRGLCFLGRAYSGNGSGTVLLDSSGKTFLHYLWGLENEFQYSPDSGAESPADGWHSMIQVWDGSLFRIFVDGRECEPTPKSDTVTRTKGTFREFDYPMWFYIGTGANNMFFAGWMDEVALWNRALTAAERAAYLEGGVPTGKAPAPVPAELKIEEGTVALAEPSAVSSLTNGIVLNYRFDTPETLYQDSGPNGYTLTEGTRNQKFIAGGTKVTCAQGAGEWAHGGGAAYFDGTNNLVLAGGATDGTAWPDGIPTGDSPFTLAFFFRRASMYPANTSDASDYMNQGLVFYGAMWGADCMTGNGFAFWDWQTYLWNYSNPTTHEYLILSSSGAITRYFRTDWYSVVQTWDGTEMRFYLDGENVTPSLKNPTNSPRTLETPPNIKKGRFIISGAYNNPFFKGWMDDVTIWNRALAEHEVVAFTRYGLQAETDTHVTVAVDENGTLEPLGGAFAFGGTLAAGGTLTGDLMLKDGVTVRSETNRTMAVSGSVTLAGAGTFAPESAPAGRSVVWTPFDADGGYADGAETNLLNWSFADLPAGWTSKFRIEKGAVFKVSAHRIGCIVLIK